MRTGPLIRMRALLAGLVDRAQAREDGATAVEYGLLIGFVALAIVAALVLLGPQVASLYQSAVTAVPAS